MTGLHGDVDDGFGPLADALAAGLDGAEHGLACCVHVAGRVVADVWGGTADRVAGRGFGSDTIAVLHTATTGAVAVCAALMVERHGVVLDAPVADYWPAFAQRGKGAVTVRHVLAHRVGLAAPDAAATDAGVLAVEPPIDALAAQPLVWSPNAGHGYDAVTFGRLVGELVRRRTGRTLGAFFASEVAEPLGLELWLGLPGSHEWRVAPLVAPEPAVPVGVAAGGALGDHARLNSRALHATEAAGVNGTGTARSLSAMYAATVGALDGGALLMDSTVRLLAEASSDGTDRVLGRRTRFGLGFSLPTPDWPLLGDASFGSIGIGNALGFADRARAVGFGYVTNQLGTDTRPAVAMSSAVAALRRCLDGPARLSRRYRSGENASGSSR
jgi:CubicO group peptidase (beta-lactamase class C family)